MGQNPYKHSDYMQVLKSSMLLVLHNIQNGATAYVVQQHGGVLLPLKLPLFHADIKT